MPNVPGMDDDILHLGNKHQTNICVIMSQAGGCFQRIEQEFGTMKQTGNVKKFISALKQQQSVFLIVLG